MSEQVLRALLVKHRLSAGRVRRAVVQGIANDAWLAGEWVIRIGKDPDYEEDSFTESVAVSVARAAGVPTPELVVFDADRDLVGGVVTIYRRAVGRVLSRARRLDAGPYFFELGRQLASLHAVAACPDPEGYLDEGWFADPLAGLGATEVPAGLLEVATPWAKRLADGPIPAPVFAHQDLHPDNLLVDRLGLPVILDWGDAGWGEPACDFRFVPPRWLEDALAGYGRDLDLRRVALHQLEQFVYAQVRRRSYGAFGDTTWPEVESLCRRALEHAP